VGRFAYRKERAHFKQGKAKKMSSMMSNRIKALAVGVAITCALGGGAAVLLPSFANAAPVRHSLDPSLGYVSHTAHDAAAGHVRRSADDAPDHIRGDGPEGVEDGKHGGTDDGPSQT
jgi:hypothetical protein